MTDLWTVARIVICDLIPLAFMSQCLKETVISILIFINTMGSIIYLLFLRLAKCILGSFSLSDSQ